MAELRASEGGGRYVPKQSISAIIRAAKASPPGSSIFVFTDALASDEDRLNEARTLIARNNVRVTFVFVNSFEKRSTRNSGENFRAKRQLESGDAYHQLVALSGGQFLNIHTTEISELASLISFSAMKSCQTIYRGSENLAGVTVHSVLVDSSIEQVTISANGAGIIVLPINPSGDL